MKAEHVKELERWLDRAKYWVDENGGWYACDHLCNEHDLRWFCKRLQPLYNRKLKWKIYDSPDTGLIGAIGFDFFFKGDSDESR